MMVGVWTIALFFTGWKHAPPGVDGYRSFITFSAGGTTMEYNGAPSYGPCTGAWEFLRAGEFTAIWLKPIYNFQTGALQGYGENQDVYTNEVRR
jgi:hypothetical protein